MLKNKYFLITLSLLFALEISATGYITEIINNTGHAMTIDSDPSSANFHVVKSYSLENASEIQPMMQYHRHRVVLHPLSRNIIHWLSIPAVNATHPSYHLQYHSQIPADFYKSCIAVSYGHTPIAFRQKGDMLEISHDGCCNLNIHSIASNLTKDYQRGRAQFEPFLFVMEKVQIPNGQWLNLRKVNQTVVDEKIDNENTYSLKITMQTNVGYGIVIARNTIAPNLQREKTARPIATIINFSETSPTMKAVVGFDRFVTDDFFNKFIKIIDNNDFFKRLSKMVTADLPTGRLLTFELYTHITKDEFQKIIDALNAQPL